MKWSIAERNKYTIHAKIKYQWRTWNSCKLYSIRVHTFHSVIQWAKHISWGVRESKREMECVTAIHTLNTNTAFTLQLILFFVHWKWQCNVLSGKWGANRIKLNRTISITTPFFDEFKSDSQNILFRFFLFRFHSFVFKYLRWSATFTTENFRWKIIKKIYSPSQEIRKWKLYLGIGCEFGCALELFFILLFFCSFTLFIKSPQCCNFNSGRLWIRCLYWIFDQLESWVLLLFSFFFLALAPSSIAKRTFSVAEKFIIDFLILTQENSLLH